MPNNDWDPDLYLKFKTERTQPSIDLISRIDISFKPKSMLDVGCGPGNSSQALLKRWPNAILTGIDNSVSMIEKAKVSYPNAIWVVADAASYTSKTKYDIVFSNATLQWIPNHDSLFKKLFNLINNGGVLAIQVPRFNQMPISSTIQKVSSRDKWNKATKGCSDLFTYHDANYYYDLMSADYKSLELWQTDYIHIMESQESILEWIRSAGLKPYLDRLGDEEKSLFEKDVLSEIKYNYPSRKNGKVLFIFKRLFMIGYKGG